MSSLKWVAILGFTALLAVAQDAGAQQRNLHIGYVYPAGGKQGSTFETVIAGQFLEGVCNVHVSGNGVHGEIVELVRPISGKELNLLRAQMDELLARKAVVRNDLKTLERFRSFKNAKTVEQNDESKDEQLEALKRKYADAAWTEEDDSQLAEIRKKMTGGVRKPANPAISELAVVRMTVDPHAKLGQRDLRIATPTTLSNPLVFHVGQLPEFSKEATKVITQQKSAVAKTAVAPKNRKAKPEMSVTLPAVVNGQMMPGAVDRFRFTATQGQGIVVVANARQLIPYIPDAVPGWFQATLALYDSEGKELAYDDDFRFDPDPVLYCQIPDDGEYRVEIKDAIYRGREDFVYRITIGELPFVTSVFPLGGPAGARTSVEVKGWNLPVTSAKVNGKGKHAGVYPVSVGTELVSNAVPFRIDTLPECLDVEPNNQPEAAQRVELPLIVNGHVDQPGDWDVFRFEGRAGAEIVAEVHARRLNSPLDSLLKLTDASGTQLAMNNDCEDRGSGLITHHADSWFRVTLPADGTYDLHLGDAQHKGGSEFGYRLRISPPQPDFELRIVPSTINARAGTTVPVTVYAVRRDGFSAAIDIRLVDAPEGFRLSGGRVPPNQDQLRLTLTVPPTSPDQPVDLQLAGCAIVQGQDICHCVVPAEDMMQAFAYRHLVPAQSLAVAVSGRGSVRSPFEVRGEMPIKIPAGGTVLVPITTSKSQFFRRSQVQLDEPPEGIAIDRVTSTRTGLELVFKSDAAKVEPGQQGNLILAAGAKASSAAGKGKAKSSRARKVLATLPALPFTIVEPIRSE